MTSAWWRTCREGAGGDEDEDGDDGLTSIMLNKQTLRTLSLVVYYQASGRAERSAERFFEIWRVLCSDARTWLSWQRVSLYWIALVSFCQALISHNNGFWVIAFLLFPIFLWLWKSLNLCRVWNEGHSPGNQSAAQSTELGNDFLSVLHSLSLFDELKLTD